MTSVEFRPDLPPVPGVLALVRFADDPVAAPHALESLRLPDDLLAVLAAEARAGSAAGRGRALGVVTGPSGPVRLLWIDAGPRAAFDLLTAVRLGGWALKALEDGPANQLTLVLPGGSPDELAYIALGVRDAAYRFDACRAASRGRHAWRLEQLVVVTGEAVASRAAFAPLLALADGVDLARDLVSEPPNRLGPPVMAARLQALEHFGIEVEVLDEPAMAALGMGSLLGVGQGSAQASRLVVLQWRGGADDAAPLALVGKGVCFDSGGLSLKAAKGMEEMKWDMAGAAAIAAAVQALAAARTPLNVVAVLGLVENMPDGAAQRPGDVVTSMSGQTIEIISTDAEGRLVLADALWYCEDRFAPAAMIDLATLTGAQQVALGDQYAGLFCDDAALSKALLAAAAASGDGLWRLPLADAYEHQIRSEIADLKNKGEPWGGAITAALFLRHFVRATPWAHVDMASTAWRAASDRSPQRGGATGFGVRLIWALGRSWAMDPEAAR